MQDETWGRRWRDRFSVIDSHIQFFSISMSHLERLLLSFWMLWFDAFQKPLPKVPVPELKETLNKYLQCIKPTVSDEQYACTQKFVDEFGKTGGLGEYLQRNWSNTQSLEITGWVWNNGSVYWLSGIGYRVSISGRVLDEYNIGSVGYSV